MRIQTRRFGRDAEGDLTPMIDMTFQLIAFFMVLINFTEAEQSERVTLPASELARPPDAAQETPVTIQLTRRGRVLFGGEEVSVANLRPLLLRESQMLDRLGQSAAAATVIIRADASAKAGLVQELIKLCQESGFERFALRAKQEEKI